MCRNPFVLCFRDLAVASTLTRAFSSVHSVVDMCARATRDDKCMLSESCVANFGGTRDLVGYTTIFDFRYCWNQLGADVRDLR